MIGRVVGAGALVLGLLAGCTTDTPDPTCPRAAAVSELSRITLFRDATGRDLTDIMMEGQIEVRASKCSFNRNAVDVEMQLAVTASIGPASRTRAYDLDYFVAVVDPEQNVTRHESFRVRMQFPQNQSRQGLSETIETRIPLRDRLRAPGHEVLVGFQLTDAQLQWNRTRR